MAIVAVLLGSNKDEGSINTWDRAPYITTLRNGTASTIPAWNSISNNFCERATAV